MSMEACPICKVLAEVKENDVKEMNTYKCDTCGEYHIHQDTKSDYFNNKERLKYSARISAYLRRRTIRSLPKVTLLWDKENAYKDILGITVTDIIREFPRTITERIDLALFNLSRLSKYAGDYIKISSRDYSIFYADDDCNDALKFMLKIMYSDDYIESEISEVKYPPNTSLKIRLTSRGWNRIAEIEKAGGVYTRRAFTAMWFDAQMMEVFEEYISKAVRECGYDPFIIPMKEHNNDICDEIIAEVRNSRFVIADFTGQRGGVYFEAGFAYGLGLPVIWSCKDEWMDKLHFDVNYYNFIVWKDCADLYKKLLNRIKATIT
jgi:hypothetical protein